MNAFLRAQLRELPSLHGLLDMPQAQGLAIQYGQTLTTECAREVLERVRQQLRGGEAPATDLQDLADALALALEQKFASSLVPVINATGVILHTNLGRAPLSAPALAAVNRVAQGYCSLEYSLEQGARSHRYMHCRTFLRQLTGAPDAVVVNNNAAAMLLILSAFCQDQEVIISRSQLLEIGGGFRIPDILAQSGARLVEVGTTNRTYVADYERALTPDTAAILQVHASNFRQTGFVHQPALADLVAMVTAHNESHKGEVRVFHDLGSGLLRPDSQAFQSEYTVAQSVQEGADLTAFSGDKLLGGPQAGIIVGDQKLVARLLRHPLMRVLRVDKMVLAALAATLEAHLAGRASQEVPVLAMGAQSLSALRDRAEPLVDRIRHAGMDAHIVETEAAAGGGSLPQFPIRSVAVALHLDQPDTSSAQLRSRQPPVVARIAQDRLLLDLRTVLPAQDPVLLQAVLALRG